MDKRTDTLVVAFVLVAGVFRWAVLSGDTFCSGVRIAEKQSNSDRRWLVKRRAVFTARLFRLDR